MAPWIVSSLILRPNGVTRQGSLTESNTRKVRISSEDTTSSIEGIFRLRSRQVFQAQSFWRRGFGVGPYRLPGKLAKVDKVRGGYEIIDYKTPREIPGEMDTLQLDIYQVGFYTLGGEVARKLSFYYLRQGKKRSIEKDRENIQRTQQFLSQVAWKMGSDGGWNPGLEGIFKLAILAFIVLTKPAILSLSLKPAGLTNLLWVLGSQSMVSLL